LIIIVVGIKLSKERKGRINLIDNISFKGVFKVHMKDCHNEDTNIYAFQDLNSLNSFTGSFQLID